MIFECFADLRHIPLPLVTIACVCHSEGSVLMTALLATYKRFNDVIRPLVALGPGGSHLQYEEDIRDLLVSLLPILTALNVRARSAIWKLLSAPVAMPILSPLYVFILGLVQGDDAAQMDNERLFVFLNHLPAGSSVRNLVQFCRQLRDRQFRKFDHGARKNIQIYGQVEPPAYAVANITNRFMAFIFGNNDRLIPAKSAFVLRNHLTGNRVIQDH